MNEFSLFDLLPNAEEFKPKKATDWKWTMANDYPPKNGLKVFSCFACGGGSTMGYKLAGCDVIGCCEIDKRMNDVYIANHHPKLNFLMDIREFNKQKDLPEELFELDILDSSPPCSTFSMAGSREEAWGVEKKFREGQTAQTLDDLLFVSLETVNKLKPKVFIMENVEGLILGNAWKYVRKIYETCNKIGYKANHYLLKGEKMGIPQSRHRVVFVGVRNDIDFNFDKVDMTFNYEPILYGTYKTKEEKIAKGKMHDAIIQAKPNESVDEVMFRVYGNHSGITHRIVREDEVYPTQTAGHGDIWTVSGNHPSDMDVLHSQTFPEDYDFGREKSEYICGMSVPPVMIKRLMDKLIESGLFDYKLKNSN